MEPAARTVIQTQSPLIGLPPGSGPLSVIVSKMDPLTKFFARTTCKRLYDMISFPVYLELTKFDKLFGQKPWRVAEKLCTLVAREGFQSLIEWARERNYPWSWGVCAAAAAGGHMKIIIWARQQSCPEWEETVCEAAARHGHFELLKWLRSMGCPWNDLTAEGAARGGHIAIWNWARERGCLSTPSAICTYAAMHGQLEFLKNEHANQRFVGGATTCSNAASEGHLEVLKWLRSPEINCYWNHLTCYRAAESGHLETLEWAVVNGAPWNPKNCVQNAKDPAVKAWIEEWIKNNPASDRKRIG